MARGPPPPTPHIHTPSRCHLLSHLTCGKCWLRKVAREPPLRSYSHSTSVPPAFTSHLWKMQAHESGQSPPPPHTHSSSVPPAFTSHLWEMLVEEIGQRTPPPPCTHSISMPPAATSHLQKVLAEESGQSTSCQPQQHHCRLDHWETKPGVSSKDSTVLHHTYACMCSKTHTHTQRHESTNTPA